MHDPSENYRAMRLREFRVLAPILFFGNVKFAPTLFLKLTWYYKSSWRWKLIKTLQVVTHLCASLVLCNDFTQLLVVTLMREKRTCLREQNMYWHSTWVVTTSNCDYYHPTPPLQSPSPPPPHHSPPPPIIHLCSLNSNYLTDVTALPVMLHPQCRYPHTSHNRIFYGNTRH
jgi:hypothetical protein